MNRKGFSLIELLVVIAIIAILAAILFPVFGQVRTRVRQTQCMAQMHDIYVAAKQYKEDNGRYPAALFGFAEDSTGNLYAGGSPANIAALHYKPLFTKQNYLRDSGLFQCPVTKDKNQLDVTRVVYPDRTAKANTALAGSSVIYDTSTQHNMGYEGSAYTGGVPPIFPGVSAPVYYYKYDNYDIQPKPNVTLDGPEVGGAYEIHYALNWSIKPVCDTMKQLCTPVTSAADYANYGNQMKYGDKADESHTVVTWCSEHAMNANSNQVLVLSLSGKVKPVDKKAFYSLGPLDILK